MVSLKQHLQECKYNSTEKSLLMRSLAEYLVKFLNKPIELFLERLQQQWPHSFLMRFSKKNINSEGTSEAILREIAKAISDESYDLLSNFILDKFLRKFLDESLVQHQHESFLEVLLYYVFIILRDSQLIYGGTLKEIPGFQRWLQEETAPGDISGEMPRNLPEEMSGRIPEEIPRGTPRKMPGRISEEISGKKILDVFSKKNLAKLLKE